MKGGIKKSLRKKDREEIKRVTKGKRGYVNGAKRQKGWKKR
jgi:hypothetical protein